MSDFLQKTTKINVFLGFGANLKKPRKTQGPFENPRKNPSPSEKTQEPKIALKNPRSCEKTQAVATLESSSANTAQTIKLKNYQILNFRNRSISLHTSFKTYL